MSFARVRKGSLSFLDRYPMLVEIARVMTPGKERLLSFLPKDFRAYFHAPFPTWEADITCSGILKLCFARAPRLQFLCLLERCR